MTLAELVRNAPLWRSRSFPFAARHLAVVAQEGDVPHLGRIINPGNARAVAGIILVGDSSPAVDHLVFQLSASERIDIPKLSLEQAARDPSLEFVLFSADANYTKAFILQNLLLNSGVRSLFLAMPHDPDDALWPNHAPDYLDERREALEAVFERIADEESKRVFAGRIRALTTGTAGYVPHSCFAQYFHPLVPLRPGDVVIDGGISGDVRGVLEFADIVGPQGAILAFEPDPLGFAEARDALAQHPDAHVALLPLGLWHETDTVRLRSSQGGSQVLPDSEDTGEDIVEIRTTSIDEAVAEHTLPRVDFIKLDVEGAEFNTIRGALRTIARFKPNLAISVYHGLDDLHAIPELLLKMCPDYVFHFGHHHPDIYDTVLYATARTAAP
jgi:FkbM family methyltransferase